MLSIMLSYAIDGTNIANLISEELSDSKPSWKFNRYPLINKNDISHFCSSISNGSLKTDIIIFICTDDFYEKLQIFYIPYLFYDICYAIMFF